jgi:thiamine phosphate synthase YjbQ (UPF0047 family)
MRVIVDPCAMEIGVGLNLAPFIAANERVLQQGVLKIHLHDNVTVIEALLKAALVGPSETIPLIGARLGLSRWQNVFLCEFKGPGQERSFLVTVLADR